MACVLSLSGCATFHAHPLTAGTSAATLQQRSLQSSDLRDYLARHDINVTRWPLQQWSVASLVLVAHYYDPNLAIARDRWFKAIADERTAAAYPNPSVSLTPLYTTNALVNISPWTVDIGAALRLITAGKHGDRIAVARAHVEAARYTFMQAEWVIDAQVKNAWLDLVTARRRQLLLEARVEDTRALFDADTAAVNAGQSPPFDAFATKRLWNKAMNAVVTGRAATARAQQALANAIGIPDGRLAKIRISATDRISRPRSLPPESQLQTFVLTQRADVRADVLRYAASQFRLKLAIAQQYPSITVGPGYRWDQGAHRWSLGFSLILPVFNQNQGPIAEARAQRTLRADQLRALQLELISQLKNAVTTYRTAQRMLELALQRLRDDQKQVRDDHTALTHGQIARTTWLRARIALVQGELDVIDAHAQLLHARLRIATLIEHPLGSDTAPNSKRLHAMSWSCRFPSATT